MKLQKESLWILLALIVSPFYFVYREPSCVGEVYTKWLHGAVSIEVLDRQGRLFWVSLHRLPSMAVSFSKSDGRSDAFMR